MTVTRVWFDNDYIYAEDERGRVMRQSLLWYSNLRAASDEERNNYTIGLSGIHWRNLNEDVSFESFEYPDAEPTVWQRFFLTHKEIDVAEFANRIGLSASLLHKYINGFKVPLKEQEEMIFNEIGRLQES